MITIINPKEKNEFNKLASHPLQAWEWGEFRLKTGIEVVRLGKYKDEKLVETAQLTIHQIPFTSFSIGYLPKSGIPSRDMFAKLYEVGKQYKCVFIKLEPNVQKDTKIFRYEDIKNNKYQSPDILISQYPNIFPSPHPLFTKYTFQLDLTKSEEELLKNMHPKTRYNIKVAQKNGVVVTQEESNIAFNDYLALLFTTAKRQKFFAHDKKYHQLMWETLKTDNRESRRSGIHDAVITQPSQTTSGQTTDNRNRLTAHLLVAKHQPSSGKKPLVLTTWIVFLLNNILYYPYGASSNEHRHLMASNLMMWETIRFGKKNGAKLFDMWGALGPNPVPKDPWYGFHRFKQGYGTKLVEFAGSFDLVINPFLYRIYNFTHKLREILLKL